MITTKYKIDATATIDFGQLYSGGSSQIGSIIGEMVAELVAGAKAQGIQVDPNACVLVSTEIDHAHHAKKLVVAWRPSLARVEVLGGPADGAVTPGPPPRPDGWPPAEHLVSVAYLSGAPPIVGHRCTLYGINDRTQMWVYKWKESQ